MFNDIWAWLQGALSAVYSKDGLVGIAAIVVLVLVVWVVLWWTGVDVLGLFG